MKSAASTAANFAVGGGTGSHAGYKAGVELERVRPMLPPPAPSVAIIKRVRSRKPSPAPASALPCPLDVRTDTRRQKLDCLKGNKFHEGLGQPLHYDDASGQQLVLAPISEHDEIFGDEQQKLEYVSGLCAEHGVEVWALIEERE